MKQNEFEAFSKLLSDVSDYYGRNLTPAAVGIYWNALSGFDLNVVKALLNEHVKASKFMPSVAELLDAINALDGRPGVEEAWSICAKSLNDEGVTIVWTEEMAQAFGVALGLQDDSVAARMAFRERYQNLVENARKQGKVARWTPSLGHDPYGREGPIMEAVKRGRITHEHALKLLPYRDRPSESVKQLIANVPKQLERAPFTERESGQDEKTA